MAATIELVHGLPSRKCLARNNPILKRKDYAETFATNYKNETLFPITKYFTFYLLYASKSLTVLLYVHKGNIRWSKKKIRPTFLDSVHGACQWKAQNGSRIALLRLCGSIASKILYNVVPCGSRIHSDYFKTVMTLFCENSLDVQRDSLTRLVSLDRFEV
jgi:hypothetical protein